MPEPQTLLDPESSKHSSSLFHLTRRRLTHTMALPPVSKAFPDTPQTSGLMAPCRFEGEVRNLEIVGSIPKEIDGTFYRVMPDPQFPAFIGDDPV